MGYASRDVTVHVMLSRHNSERDVEHDDLWADLRRRLAAICEEPKYWPISVLTSGMDADD